MNHTRQLSAETIEKLVHRVLDPDPTARTVAANVLFNNVNNNGLHPTDLRVTLANGSSTLALIEQLRDTINRQYREIEFLRRNVEPAVLEKAALAGTVEYRWSELLELICTRLTGDDPETTVSTSDLTPGWKMRLRTELGVSPGALHRWEQGVEQIPQWVFDQMTGHAMAPQQRSPSKRKADSAEAPAASTGKRKKKVRKHADDNFDWTKEKYVQAFELLRSGKSLEEAGVPIGAVYNQMSGKYYNQAPREDWLGVITIAADGPMTYLELWKIGYALHGEGWKSKITSRLHLPKNALLFNDPDWLILDKCNELRQEYRAMRIVKRAKDPSPLENDEFEAIHSLWQPKEICLSATRRFVITHVQIEPGSLLQPEMGRQRGDLRERYHEEIKYRRQSARYLHMSRGLALLEKRTDKQLSAADNKSDMSGAALQAFGDAWFGTGSHRYLAQLIGYTGSYFKEAYEGGRDITAAMQQIVQNIATCVDGLDLDDPGCEVQIVARVSRLGGSL